MNNRKTGWLVIVFLFIATCTVAQTVPVSKDRKAERYYRSAVETFRRKEYNTTLELLEKAAKTDSGFAELYLLRADVYDRTGETEREIESVLAAFRIDPAKYSGYYYSLAACYFKLGNYTEALNHYQNYLQKDKRLRYEAEARKNILNCEFALKALNEQTKQEVSLFIDSERDVYWPSLDVTKETALYTQLDNGEENIWILKDGLRYSLSLNTPENEGTQSITADGQMMYFTACGRPGGLGSCDIYVAYRLADSVWSRPVNLGAPLNSEAWDAQPAISADGRRLYFASTREGGRGGSDIWYSTLLRRDLNGRQYWSEPRCLYFNTPGDEMAPFLYYDNKTLFFSSDGYPGMGKKDIYKVDVEKGSEPFNIGITVNTYRDELGFFVDATGKWGYFSSDVSGKKSIYRYQLEEGVACPEASYVRLSVCNEQQLPVAPDRLTVVTVATGDTLAYYDEVYAHPGMLACVPAKSLLLVGVLKKGYMYYSDTLYVPMADHAHPHEKNIVLRQIRKGVSFVLKGIFFDVDAYTLKNESISELQQLVAFLKLNPEMNVEISGHTDDQGTDAHNYRLSEDRAYEVYKYLFTHHIKKERMVYKGYGKDKPVVPNSSEANRAKNRRTEIKVL